MWVKMVTCIRKVARDVVGVTKGKKHETKDTWWWNEDVQKAFEEKKECYKSWHHNRSTSNIVKYKEAKKNARQVVSEVRGRAYDELYDRLSTKKGEKDIYKMAKIRKSETRNLNKLNASRTRLIDFLSSCER
jgi:hypothetical protein